jgi:hypothetical protein
MFQFVTTLSVHGRRTRSVFPALATCSLFALGIATVNPAAAQSSGSALFAVGSANKPTAGKPKTTSTKPASTGAPLQVPVAAPATSADIAGKSVGAAKPVAASKSAGASKSGNASKGKRVARKGPASPVALNGRWHDTACIPLTGVTHQPPLYVQRTYAFDDRRKSWQLDAVVFDTDTCMPSSRMLSYHGRGTYTVTGKSRVAANAYDASFAIDRWQATPINREGVLTLLNGRCGSGLFEEGSALDLSASGCPIIGIRSIAQRPRETELVRVSDGRFYMGSRSMAPGLADNRPQQLSSYGMVRLAQ